MDKTILEMHAAELISNLLQLGLKNIFLLTFFQWTLSLMTTDINVGLKKGFREVSYDSFLTTLSCNRPLEPMLPAVGKPCACNENRENHFARMGYLNSPSMILRDQQLL